MEFACPWLVAVRVEGRHRLYRIEAGPLREVHDWAVHYRTFWERKLDVLGGVLAEAERKERG